MNVQASRVLTIHDIDPALWERLTGSAPFMSARFLGFCELVFADVPVFYLLVRIDGEPAAAAVFWLRSSPVIPDLPAPAAALIGILLRRRPLLICEVPAAEACGLVLPADEPRRAAALRELARSAADLAAEQRASFAVFGYLQRDVCSSQVWPPAYRHVRLFPGTAMDLSQIREYGAYLAGLDKKRRKNLRRSLDAVAAQGVCIEVRTEIDPDAALQLVENVARRHRGQIPPELPELIRQTEAFGLRWLAAERDGRLVGLDMLMGDRDVWKVKVTGSDYTVDQLYFALSDMDIRFAIAQGARELQAGTHLVPVKQRIGYRVLEDGYVRFTGAGWLFGILGRLLGRR